jgi:hypothetical protein
MPRRNAGDGVQVKHLGLGSHQEGLEVKLWVKKLAREGGLRPVSMHWDLAQANCQRTSAGRFRFHPIFR